ncbi:MAG: hypothetical protein WA709_24230 [Stellaceae bacterium]
MLINRPELPPAGAGERPIRPVAAALVNVFNAASIAASATLPSKSVLIALSIGRPRIDFPVSLPRSNDRICP